tara:strand:+ start:2878 stop:3174 length:297 start_codon:yes stop_codon:yes gene_type:complete
MKKRNSEEEKLSDVVDKFINNFGLKKRFLEHEVIQVFNNQMGPFLMKKVINVYVKDKKLFLKLSSAAFKEEIRMQKTKLIKQLNYSLNSDYLIDVILL